MDNEKSIEQKREFYENEIKRINDHYDKMAEELDRVLWEHSNPVKTELLIKKLRKSRQALSQRQYNTRYNIHNR